MWRALIQVLSTVGGGVLAFLALMMQIAPDTAQSNLSKWLSLVTDNVPEFLRAPSVDPYVTGGLLVLALAIVVGPWLLRKSWSAGVKWYDREHAIRHNASGNSMLIEGIALKGMTGDKAIKVEDAYACSLVTGEMLPARISGREAKGCTISPRTEFELSVQIPKTHAHSPNEAPIGLSIDEFCKRFGSFELVMKVSNKGAYTVRFSQDEVAQQVRGIRSIGQIAPQGPSGVLSGAKAPAGLTNESHQTVAPIDWDKWDGLNRFKLYEMACLWEGHSPTLPLPTNKARERFERFNRDIESGGLKVIRENLAEVIRDAIAKTNSIPVAANPYWIVTREMALEYCERLGVEPALFYPKKRI